MKTVILSTVLSVSAGLGCLAQTAVVDEDFDTLTFGDTTGINQGIAAAGLRLHNHLLGEVVSPHAAFSNARGNAFQLTTGTNPGGGWGILSADNSPRAVSLVEGEEIIFSFDMYVQAVPSGTSSIDLELDLVGGDNVSRAFAEFTGASVGDAIRVSWTNTVTSGMATATAISPRISFEGHQNNFSTQGPNGDGTELDIGQLDHLKLFASEPMPNTYYLDADGGNDGNSGTTPSNAWASLTKASTVAYSAGEHLLLERGDTFNGKLVFANDNGVVGSPIVVGAYGTGNRPVIDAAGYEAGIHIQSCDYITVQDLEITGDGGAHTDGSDGTDRYGIYIKNTSGNDSDHITVSNVYFHTIYPFLESSHEGHNPTTYTGYGILASGQNGNHSEYLTVVDCHFENLGMTCLNMQRQNNVSILNNLMENIGGPCMVPNRCDDLLVRGNTIDGSGQYSDPRMHGRGSGIWPINCDGVLIENNAFMHARGRYDSCGVHLDIGNKNAVIQYNLSIDNEGGFVEILGVNSNCTYRYNISINDGARRGGVNENGLTQGDGHTILFSSHNFSGQERHGPYNSYIYNNTIYVKAEQLASFSIEQATLGILVANNLFYVEGELEDESPHWRGDYPTNMPETVIWTNNLYQRGGIFPGWIFEEGNPMYGNPKFPNAGGLTAQDYIPMPGSMVEGRSIDIPLIPGDPIGLEVGFAVAEDFFGNPIVGQPDIGAVEIGGVTSTEIGSAFDHWPEEHDGTVEMVAVQGPAGSEYYFSETSGNVGGDDSGWQTSSNYTDAGLLPNTLYTYTVNTRDASDTLIGTSIIEEVIPVTSSPYPYPVFMNEDFASTVDPENLTSPFPENTWYLDHSNGVDGENQPQSVSTYSGWLQLGFGYEEMIVYYYTDQTWALHRDYEFTGDWKISTEFENHLGISVGFGEFDSVTGAMLNSIKEIDVGDVTAPTLNSTGSFTLSLSAAELQLEDVNPVNRVGIYFFRDDDGTRGTQSGDKNDMYLVDNLFLRQIGDDLDTDGDGIPDSVEESIGLDLESDGDYDEDSLLNADEVLVGTPLDSASTPFTVGISNTAQVVVSDAWVLSNRVYILEHKDALISSNGWKAVDFVSGSAEAGNGDYVFPSTGTDTQSFYRVRVEWE